MITVVVTGGREARDLHILLSALVPAAAEGLVRQVLVLDDGLDDAARELCEDAGADIFRSSLSQALSSARGDWILAAPADLRLRRGWDAAVRDHLDCSGAAALVLDAAHKPGWLGRLHRPATAGVLAPRKEVRAMGEELSMTRLLRMCGRRAPRLS